MTENDLKPGVPPPAPKILIIYNARSGHRKMNFDAYLRALAKHDARVELRSLSRHFNLKELLADAASFDRIVVAGGDGTVSAAAGMLQNSKVPIIAYPGGTANLLARNLNMPSNPEALAAVTLAGKVKPTDLGEMEFLRYRRRDFFRRRVLKRRVPGTPVKIHFAIMAGCGFAARLMSQAQPWKSKLGEAAYWVSALGNLFPRRAQFKIRFENKKVEAKGIGILIVNFEKIQFDLKVVPESLAEDGKVEIAVIKARSLFGLGPILWGALRQRLGFSRPPIKEIMETYQASELEIESKPPLRLQSDGEILQKTSSFKIRVTPGAACFVYGGG